MRISQARQASIMKQCEEHIRKHAPRDTGNLSLNAVKVENKGDGVWEIWVDVEIAPYMKYTNENWNEFRPPLHGKQNPNEGWFDRTAEEIALIVANRLKGKTMKE